ncbi:MAG: 23S rRNA (pseudouridine(1915)-N(3))-methyltransferase RlmH [Prevotellaceae bacterium]|jgi:23S rRNA (pseudouridine1915-N3)-methyltransferase|nr:23S rRNA (pseudouridine(1915)-N(3))-methyltransferase RlmH [Prevotellaceae bacterium]
MKIKFMVVGKTDDEHLRKIMEDYERRLMHYTSFETVCVAEAKNAGKLSEALLKVREGEKIMELLNRGDELILLDAKGQDYSSTEFSSFVAKRLDTGSKCLVFLAGGACGFSDEIYAKASCLVSLSRMTFTHQIVRIIFLEQLYRAFTIIRNERYHR